MNTYCIRVAPAPNSKDDIDPSMTQNELFCNNSLPAHWHGYETHTGAIPFPPRSRLLRGVTFLGPIRFPQHLFSVHDHGRLRSSWEPQLLPRPDCTLSRLRAEEYDRPVTQSIATFEDDPHPISSAGRLPEP